MAGPTSNSGRSNAAAASPTQPAQPPNTIRLSGTDLAKLHAVLSATGDKHHVKRGFVRWPFQREIIRVELTQPGGSAAPVLHLAARNISSTGISLLHSAYVHTGQPCLVHLSQLSGTHTPLTGKVVRCRHVRGLIHEVGIQFASSINVRDYLRLDPMQGAFTLEKVKPEALTGGVLHVEDSAADRRLVRHYLRDTSLNVVTAEDGASGLARAAEGFDIIVLDYDLPDMNGAAFVEQLRAQSIQTPVIVLTADTDPRTRDKMREVRASGFLTKPADEEQLLRAVAEFLLADGGGDAGGPVYTSLKPDDAKISFVAEFVGDLKKAAATIHTAIKADDLNAAKRACFQIKGSAPALGFGGIAAAAEAAMTQLNATMSVAESIKPLKTLLSMCLNARAREVSRRAG